MTADRLKAIQDREKLATKGPWEVRRGGNFTDIWREGSTRAGEPSAHKIADINYRQSDLGGNTPDLSVANASFIAHARQDIPDLLAALDEAQELLKAVKFIHDEWSDSPDANLCKRIDAVIGGQ